MSVPAWQVHESRLLQRRRWLAYARAEATAAAESGELHIAAVFRIVVATIEADRLPPPPCNGREVLMGRQAIRDEAVRLARAGLSSRSVAVAVGQPYGTVYAWLRRAGAVQRRNDWLAEVRSPRRTEG